MVLLLLLKRIYAGSGRRVRYMHTRIHGRTAKEVGAEQRCSIKRGREGGGSLPRVKWLPLREFSILLLLLLEGLLPRVASSGERSPFAGVLVSRSRQELRGEQKEA